MQELKRVLFSRNRLAVLLALLAVCLLNLTRPGLYVNEMAAEDRARTEEQLAMYGSMPLEQAMEALNAATDGGTMLTWEYSEIYYQVQYLLGFEDNLAEIQAKAKNMSTVSIFAGSPYSQANIRKTASDYARLEGAAVTLGTDRPVTRVMESGLSDWLLGAYMLIVVYAFLGERKRGLWNTVCASPQGRTALALWRLGTVATAALIAAPAFTLVELLYCYTRHGGWGELNRIVQSVSLFRQLTVPMTVGQFWLFYMGLRILGAFFLGLCAWFLLEVISDRRLVAAGWVLVGAVEYSLTGLTETSIARQVNLFTYLQPRKLVTSYNNLNLLGRPVGQLPLVLLAGALLGLAMLCVIVLIYGRRKPVAGYHWVDRLLEWAGRLFSPLGRHTSLLGHEVHRTVSTGRGWMILLAALAAAFLLSDSPGLGDGKNTAMYLESYYRQSQGPVTEDTQNYLEQRQERLEDLYAQRDQAIEQYRKGELSDSEFQGKMMQYDSLDVQAQALELYAAHLGRLQAWEGSYVLPHWVYQELLGVNRERTDSLLLTAVLAVLLLFFTQAGTERRTAMVQTRLATVRGRGYLQVRRHGAAWVIAALLSVAVWCIQLLQLLRSYGELPWLEAPVRCLSYFEQLPPGISILGYWLLLVAIRTMGLCMLSSGVLAVTEAMRKRG